MNKYFVVYKFKGGHGRAEVERDRPITGFEDIQRIEQKLSETVPGNPDVAITCWRRFERTPWWRRMFL